MASKSSGLTSQSDAEMRDWQAESDLRTLIDAEKIKADKARLKAAMAKQAEMKKSLNALEAQK